MTEPIDYRNLKPHPLAKLFPKYTTEDMNTLAEDIKVNGLHNKITLFEGKLLDGVNRYKALSTIGFLSPDPYYDRWGTPLFEHFDGGDLNLSGGTGGDVSPIDFVISANINRRHLTDDQRAAIAAKLATMSEGRPKKHRQLAELSVGDAAVKMKVSKRTVERAKAVEKQDPALNDEVIAGTKTLAAATKEAAMKKSTPDTASENKVEHKPAPLPPALAKAIKALLEQHGFEAVRDAVLEYMLVEPVSFGHGLDMRPCAKPTMALQKARERLEMDDTNELRFIERTRAEVIRFLCERSKFPRREDGKDGTEFPHLYNLSVSNLDLCSAIEVMAEIVEKRVDLGDFEDTAIETVLGQFEGFLECLEGEDRYEFALYMAKVALPLIRRPDGTVIRNANACEMWRDGFLEPEEWQNHRPIAKPISGASYWRSKQ